MKTSYSDDFFNVSSKHGFLPIEDPLHKLPIPFTKLQHILEHMPVVKNDGTPGYLAEQGHLAKAVAQLPNYIETIKEITDMRLISALYRSYAFLTSAYLLAPSYHNPSNEDNKASSYGKARTFLPANLAQPFDYLASKLGVYPWLDYSYAYSLGNYVKKDTDSYDWQNLGMAVSFSGCSDESGFIMVHVDINQYSPALIESIHQTFAGIKNEAEAEVVTGLKNCYETMLNINSRRKLMWQASDHRHYNKFRAFIMGIEGNEEIFGDGVIYEGCSNNPRKYRGQTGAQDTIIPTMDIFTGLINHYPKNELTDYLLDLRSYRPKVFREFLADIEVAAKNIYENVAIVGGCKGLIYLLAIVDQIYYFRNGHWQFVQKYIMKNTKYAKATGGTPIICWIPNQIQATLKYERSILTQIEILNPELAESIDLHQSIKYNLMSKEQLLERQMRELQEVGYDAEKVYEFNHDYALTDVE